MSMTLKVATPEKPVLETEIDYADVPGEEGYLGIRPGHIQLVSLLATGKLIYGKKDGERSYLAVSGGFLEIKNDVLHILADEAYLPEDLDKEGLEQIKEESQRKIEEEEDPEKIEEALYNLKKAKSWSEMLEDDTS